MNGPWPGAAATRHGKFFPPAGQATTRREVVLSFNPNFYRRTSICRDIILNLAISLDGFICDEDGGFAWISGQGDVRADTADHFDFDGFLASCDTIVMGRKAYEDCLSSLPEAAEKRFLVASRTPRAPEGRVVFLSADVVAEVLALKDRPGTVSYTHLTLPTKLEV